RTKVMNKLSKQSSWFLCLIVLCVPRSWAGACDSITLPQAIKSTLAQEFAGWNTVTPDVLTSPDDRRIWHENYNSECPGIIKGHFNGQRTGYVINLVRGSGKTLEQQIVFFAPTNQGFRRTVLDPPSHVATVSVIRKFSPGMYKSPDSGRSVKVEFDTIGISEI